MKVHLFYLSVIAAVVSYSYYNHQRIHSVSNEAEEKERKWEGERELLKTEVSKLHMNIANCKDNTEKVHTKSRNELVNLKRSYEAVNDEKSSCAGARVDAEAREQRLREELSVATTELEGVRSSLAVCASEKDNAVQVANNNYASYEQCVTDRSNFESNMNQCYANQQAIQQQLDEARIQLQRSGDNDALLQESLKFEEERARVAEEEKMSTRSQLDVCQADLHLCKKEKSTDCDSALRPLLCVHG